MIEQKSKVRGLGFGKGGGGGTTYHKGRLSVTLLLLLIYESFGIILYAERV